MVFYGGFVFVNVTSSHSWQKIVIFHCSTDKSSFFFFFVPFLWNIFCMVCVLLLPSQSIWIYCAKILELSKTQVFSVCTTWLSSSLEGFDSFENVTKLLIFISLHMKSCFFYTFCSNSRGLPMPHLTSNCPYFQCPKRIIKCNKSICTLQCYTFELNMSQNAAFNV